MLIYHDEVCIHYSNEHCIKHIISIHCRCQEESRGREEIRTLAIVDHKHHKLPVPRKTTEQEAILFLSASPPGYLSVSIKFLH